MAEIYARDVRAAARGSGWLACARPVLVAAGGLRALDALDGGRQTPATPAIA